MPLRVKDLEVEIMVKQGLYIPIKDLRENSYSRDGGRIYKYFLSIVELAADLAQGRNMRAVIQLQQIFNLDSSIKIIYDKELPFDLRSYFIELFLNMYLDKEPLEPL